MFARGATLGNTSLKLCDLNALEKGRYSAPLKSAEMSDKKKQPRVVIKKAVDKRTLWAACRAVFFGSLLIGLGIAMSTIGYFSSEFATYTLREGNRTVQLLSASTEKQYRSLQYIGPIIMGVGAFVLMVACVMTLESRDKHIRVVHEYQLPEGSEVAPPVPKATLGARPPQELSSRRQTIANVPHKSPRGVVNRSFAKDDSKTTTTGGQFRSELLSESSAVASTCVSLGESGRCVSLGHIDVLSRTADPKALLMRFLEQQSRLVAAKAKPGLQKQSMSYDVPGGPGPPLNSSLHSCCPDSPPLTFAPLPQVPAPALQRSIIQAQIHHSSEDTLPLNFTALPPAAGSPSHSSNSNFSSRETVPIGPNFPRTQSGFPAIILEPDSGSGSSGNISLRHPSVGSRADSLAAVQSSASANSFETAVDAQFSARRPRSRLDVNGNDTDEDFVSLAGDAPVFASSSREDLDQEGNSASARDLSPLVLQSAQLSNSVSALNPDPVNQTPIQTDSIPRILSPEESMQH